MNATPLISSTLASAVVFLLMKLAVMAMASFPRNSLRRNPVNSAALGTRVHILPRYQKPKIAYCALKTQPDVLRHDRGTSFSGMSTAVPEVLLLPLSDGAITTSEGGGGSSSQPTIIQENRKLIQRFLVC